MEFLETKGNTFWALIENGSDSFLLFTEKENAISKLTEFDDPNSAQLIGLSRKGKEWIIEQVSWQEIASALIRKVKK